MRTVPSDFSRVEAACSTVAAAADTAAFRRRFSNPRLLRSPHDIQAARTGLPQELLPFMIEAQFDSTDVYAFDVSGENRGRVVVWNDDAVVADWDTFEAFADWIRSDPAAE